MELDIIVVAPLCCCMYYIMVLGEIGRTPPPMPIPAGVPPDAFFAKRRRNALQCAIHRCAAVTHLLTSRVQVLILLIEYKHDKYTVLYHTIRHPVMTRRLTARACSFSETGANSGVMTISNPPVHVKHCCLDKRVRGYVEKLLVMSVFYQSVRTIFSTSSCLFRNTNNGADSRESSH